MQAVAWLLLLCLPGMSLAQNGVQPGDIRTDKAPGIHGSNSLVTFDMVFIPGGKITIEDPANPGQKVEVDVKPFWIGKNEVTWNEFDIFAMRLDMSDDDRNAGIEADVRPSKPYGAPDRGWGHDGYAAMSLTIKAAQKYCEWLSKKTGKKYRLATDAEWELAARAGATDEKGLGGADIDEIAWSWDNSEDKTHAVGEKKPNAWGLYDMFGDVAEWVETPGATPVVRGGSIMDDAEKISAGLRQPYDKSWQVTDPQDPKSTWWLSDGAHVGFRIVCEE